MTKRICPDCHDALDVDASYAVCRRCEGAGHLSFMLAAGDVPGSVELWRKAGREDIAQARLALLPLLEEPEEGEDG